MNVVGIKWIHKNVRLIHKKTFVIQEIQINTIDILKTCNTATPNVLLLHYHYAESDAFFQNFIQLWD